MIEKLLSKYCVAVLSVLGTDILVTLIHCMHEHKQLEFGAPASTAKAAF